MIAETSFNSPLMVSKEFLFPWIATGLSESSVFRRGWGGVGVRVGRVGGAVFWNIGPFQCEPTHSRDGSTQTDCWVTCYEWLVVGATTD